MYTLVMSLYYVIYPHKMKSIVILSFAGCVRYFLAYYSSVNHFYSVYNV